MLHTIRQHCPLYEGFLNRLSDYSFHDGLKCLGF